MGSAIIKQKNGLSAMIATTNCGLITARQLNDLNRLVQEQEIKALKISTRQTLILLVDENKINLVGDQLQKIGFRLGAFNNVIRSVKGCSGNDELCPRALGDALGLGIELQNRFFGQDVPHDFKISTAGCQRGCTDPLCADFGVVCHNSSSYDIYIGGTGAGRNPVHGQLLLQEVSRDDVFNTLEYVLSQYRKYAEGKQRLHNTIDKVGLNAFRPVGVKPVKDAAVIDNEFLQMLNSSKGE